MKLLTSSLGLKVVALMDNNSARNFLCYEGANKRSHEVSVGSNFFFQLLVLFSVFLVGVYRTFRFPNNWAEAHWLISYDFGFIKRGAPGSVLSLFLDDITERSIQVIATIVFFASCVLLFYVCFDLLKRGMQKKLRNGDLLIIVVLFVLSPYIPMSAHLNGYYDHILVVLSIASILFFGRVPDWFVGCLLSLGVLVHETFIVVGFPSVVFYVLLNQLFVARKKSFFSVVWDKRLLLLLTFFTFLLILLNQTFFMDSHKLLGVVSLELQNYSFIDGRSSSASKAFTYSFFDYFREQSPFFLQRLVEGYGLLNVVSGLVFFFLYFWCRLGAMPNGKLCFGILVVFTLSPLLLHSIAWDTGRIWAYPLWVSIIGLWSIEVNVPKKEGNIFSSAMLVVIALVIFSQMFVQYPLMDGEMDKFSWKEKISIYTPCLVIVLLLIYRVRSFPKNKDKICQA